MSKPGSPRFRKSNKQPDGTYPVPPRKNPQLPAGVDDLSALPIEELAKQLGKEALLGAAAIARSPGRNAAAQMRAIEMLAKYGVQELAKPPSRVENTGADGGPIQSEHRIVFVAPEGKE